jgi:FkbM family methyltransferase
MLTALDPVAADLAQAVDWVGARMRRPVDAEMTATVHGRMLMRLPPRTPSVRQLATGTYEPELTAVVCALLKPGMTFVDAGANIGYYTLLASSLVAPGGKVFAFEPDPVAFDYLETNARLNDITVASVFRRALVEHPGTVRFTRVALEGGFVSVGSVSAAMQTEIEADSLDHFFEGHGWPPVDLIKLDVEGAEPRVLAGMKSLAERNPRLKLIMEFNLIALKRAGCTPARLSAILIDLGFRTGFILDAEREVNLAQSLPVSHIVYNILLSR